MPTFAYHINTVGGRIDNEQTVAELLGEWEFSVAPQIEDGQLVIESRWSKSFMATHIDGGGIKTDEFFDQLSEHLTTPLEVVEHQVEPEEEYYKRAIEPTEN